MAKNDQISLILYNSIEVSVKQLFIATNGFTKEFLDKGVEPARTRVLITKTMEDLEIKSNFVLDKGYYYLRGIDNRILFGGGRNLDFNGEETSQIELTGSIQNKFFKQQFYLILRLLLIPGGVA